MMMVIVMINRIADEVLNAFMAPPACLSAEGYHILRRGMEPCMCNTCQSGRERPNPGYRPRTDAKLGHQAGSKEPWIEVSGPGARPFCGSGERPVERNDASEVCGAMRLQASRYCS